MLAIAAGAVLMPRGARGRVVRARPALGARIELSSARVAADRDLEVRVIVQNRTAQALPFSRVALRSPITCLRVFRGPDRVATVPPPVPSPPTAADLRPLAAGASERFVFGLGVFSPALRPGRYTIALEASLGIEAAPATFEVTGP